MTRSGERTFACRDTIFPVTFLAILLHHGDDVNGAIFDAVNELIWEALSHDSPIRRIKFPGEGGSFEQLAGRRLKGLNRLVFNSRISFEVEVNALVDFFLGFQDAR